MHLWLEIRSFLLIAKAIWLWGENGRIFTDNIRDPKTDTYVRSTAELEKRFQMYSTA